MRSKFHHWYAPELQRERERAELERIATQIIKDADRWNRKSSSRPRRTRAPAPTMPRRLTFSDLPLLPRKGLVP
jgi:hypothetical protein